LFSQNGMICGLWRKISLSFVREKTQILAFLYVDENVYIIESQVKVDFCIHNVV